MEYRGKNFLVFEEEPNLWRWAVTIDDDTTISGNQKTRPEAITQVVLAIDRLLLKWRTGKS